MKLNQINSCIFKDVVKDSSISIEEKNKKFTEAVKKMDLLNMNNA